MGKLAYSLRIVLACALPAVCCSSASAETLLTCTDGLHALSSQRYALDLAPPVVNDVTHCEPLVSSSSQASGGTGAASASAILHTIVANGVLTQALASTTQSHATATASGIARLVFRVHSDTLAPGTTIPLSYDVELLTVNTQVVVSDQGSVSLSGRGFFGLGVYDPIQDTWSLVGPTGGPLLPLVAPLDPGSIVGRTDEPLYVQVGGTFYLYLNAIATATANGIGGGISLNAAAGEMAVQITAALTAPGNTAIEWLAHEALGLPVPQLGDLGFTPVPLPAAVWLLAAGLMTFVSTRGRGLGQPGARDSWPRRTALSAPAYAPDTFRACSPRSQGR